MTRIRSILRLEDKIEGERALLAALDRPDERRQWIAGSVVATAALLLLAVAPLPSGAASIPDAAAPSGSWTTLSREMPEPPATTVVARTASPAKAPATVSIEPISLDVFRVPEPIPEPSTAAFRGTSPATEPEPPLGTPEPPPDPGGTVAQPPEVEVVPPRPAPGGKVAPQYPIAARSLRVSGTVHLQVEVDASGTVTAVRVLGTDRAGVGFEEAATRAVERWRFVPATRERLHPARVAVRVHGHPSARSPGAGVRCGA